MATRDYKHSGRKKQKPALPGWVWLLSGLAIGLFVALLVYLKDAPTPETITATPSISVSKGAQDTRGVRKVYSHPSVKRAESEPRHTPPA